MDIGPSQAVIQRSGLPGILVSRSRNASRANAKPSYMEDRNSSQLEHASSRAYDMQTQ